MKRLILGLLGIIALACTTLVAVGASPASAGECTTPAGPCGHIKHYSPDAGYGDTTGILIRCDYGDNSTNHLLYEGQNSTTYCKDTDQVYVRSNEQIACKMITSVNSYGVATWGWVVRMDAEGWHKINDIFDDGQGCVLQRD